MVSSEMLRVWEQVSAEVVSPDRREATTPAAGTTVPQTADRERSTLVVLRGGSAFVAAYYFVKGDQMYCVLQDGEVMIPLENLDLEQTVALNRERHIEFVLHRRHKVTEE